MDEIVISVTAFEKYIKNTSDHVWYGILKRRLWDKKYTKEDWFKVMNEIKKEPV